MFLFPCHKRKAILLRRTRCILRKYHKNLLKSWLHQLQKPHIWKQKCLYFYVNCQTMCFNLLWNIVAEDRIELYPSEKSTLLIATKIWTLVPEGLFIHLAITQVPIHFTSWRKGCYVSLSVNLANSIYLLSLVARVLWEWKNIVCVLQIYFIRHDDLEKTRGVIYYIHRSLGNITIMTW